MQTNRDTMASFTLDLIPDLGVAVRAALELFIETPVPKLAIPFKQPLVVGSGNAEAAGRILFEDSEALFASESTFETKLAHAPCVDGVVVISASGGKHAPIIAKKAKESGKRVALITNTPDSPASQFSEPELTFVFPKNREPYTYNTSTYMGMLISKSAENPNDILAHLDVLDALQLLDFSKFEKFFVIIPPRFSHLGRMIQVKFIELFGRRIARDVETSEYIKHAVTVVPSDELFISFGEENKEWGTPDQRLFVPLPHNVGPAGMMATSYYLVGKIQSAHPPYFKQNISAYTKHVSDVFGTTISPVVD